MALNWFRSRRVIRALESLAASQATLARIAQADEARRQPRPRTSAKLDLGTLDVDEANKLYHNERVVEMQERDE